MELTLKINTVDLDMLEEAKKVLDIHIKLLTDDAPTVAKAEEPKPKTKKTTKPKQVTQTNITLAELKEEAQAAVTRIDRQKVKECIGQFSSKLSEVKEEDYDDLFKQLKAL